MINIICAFKIIIVILLQVSLSKNNLILYYLNTFFAILITAHFLWLFYEFKLYLHGYLLSIDKSREPVFK